MCQRENAVNTVACGIDGEEYRRVDDFIYVGSTVSSNGQIAKELKARMAKVSGSFFHVSNIWKSKKIHLHTKVRLFSTVLLPLLLYTSVMWQMV